MNDFSNSSMRTPAATLTLWLFGSVGLIVSTGVLTFGFTRNCEYGSVNCTIENLIYQSGGMLGVFMSALFVVAGFAFRSKERNKRQAEYYEQLWFEAEKSKKPDSNEESS